MNTRIKTVVAAVLTALSFASLAETSPDGREYFVTNLDANLRAVQGSLTQSATGFNNSCGPTSLLFVSNHYVRNSTGKNSPNMATVSASQTTLRSVYSYLGLTSNSITDLDQIKAVARGKFGWANVARMNGSATVGQNMDNFMSYLIRDTPSLAVIRKGYGGNPIPGYDHIVVLTAYKKQTDEGGRAWNDKKNTRNLDTISYYEPFYGRTGTILRRDVTSGGSAGAFNMANFAFLALGR